MKRRNASWKATPSQRYRIRPMGSYSDNPYPISEFALEASGSGSLPGTEGGLLLTPPVKEEERLILLTRWVDSLH
jgi:hypothetical protein